MPTGRCGWTERVSAFFDGEGSAWERWRCRRHLRRCAACRCWLRRVETDWHSLRAALLPPASPRFVAAVMGRVAGCPLRVAPSSRARIALPRAGLASGGLVMVATAALALLLFNHTLQISRARTCQDNLRQLGEAIALYTDDHDGLLPPAGGLPAATLAAGRSPAILRCPSDAAPRRGPWSSSYAFNDQLRSWRLDLLQRPTTALVYEGWEGALARRHDALGHVLLGDGRVARVANLASLR